MSGPLSIQSVGLPKANLSALLQERARQEANETERNRTKWEAIQNRREIKPVNERLGF